MPIPEHIINLDLAPKHRWAFLENHRQAVQDLIACYLEDFSGEESLLQGLSSLKENWINTEYFEEIEFIASLTSFSADEVLMANLYYDVLKFYFGCTAFALESPMGTLHARNLDWHTEANLLSKHSCIFNFQKGAKTLFKSVGWPGFIGVLSGLKPGAFSISLNAVLSNDSPEFARPISFFLRDVLSQAESYLQAKELLEQTTIASDCLLLIAGTQKGEMQVIERSPKRFASRDAEENHIVVTNDYKLLENTKQEGGQLQATSCSRYDRALELLKSSKPSDAEDCLKILQDPAVQMNITVQQMVFNVKDGSITLVKT
ncbi:C45 family autoproteolytic acyltransferase/hydolase [Croceimicrobium hydrocarbonivorans]|uniref:Peptidase C45 hydrolase domain-containing protein n=1 Tax=Croceimicrobium hydrocarbonivorans TaxID=2761580 RepID=A0A7H0VEY7_9FLAO|nr:C45 family autoproteolytic acyltransferase/hydolase [Croceimicrobium hydrocarbonivorans]QNR24285.1 hypothetical protein H4K34_00160 [Croceimicrobium hydrocarbonivorans]